MSIVRVILSLTSKTQFYTCPCEKCEMKVEMYRKRYLREDELLSELQNVLHDNSDGGEIFTDDSPLNALFVRKWFVENAQ